MCAHSYMHTPHNMHIHINTDTHTLTPTHTHTHIYPHTHTHTLTYTCAHTYTKFLYGTNLQTGQHQWTNTLMHPKDSGLHFIHLKIICRLAPTPHDECKDGLCMKHDTKAGKHFISVITYISSMRHVNCHVYT